MKMDEESKQRKLARDKAATVDLVGDDEPNININDKDNRSQVEVSVHTRGTRQSANRKRWVSGGTHEEVPYAHKRKREPEMATYLNKAKERC